MSSASFWVTFFFLSCFKFDKTETLLNVSLFSFPILAVYLKGKQGLVAKGSYHPTAKSPTGRKVQVTGVLIGITSKMSDVYTA